MPIIYLTPNTYVLPESSYRIAFGQTVVDRMVIPLPARRLMGLTACVAKRALYHAHSETYAFVHDGKAYRTAMPLVLTAVQDTAHMRTCKACRDGEWCEIGHALIIGAVVPD